MNPDEVHRKSVFQKAMAKATASTGDIENRIDQLQAVRLHRMVTVIAADMIEDAAKTAMRMAVLKLRQSLASLPETEDAVAVLRSVNQLFDDFLSGLNAHDKINGS